MNTVTNRKVVLFCWLVGGLLLWVGCSLIAKWTHTHVLKSVLTMRHRGSSWWTRVPAGWFYPAGFLRKHDLDFLAGQPTYIRQRV